MDGFNVHVLEEGWKEIEAGTVFENRKEKGWSENPLH